MFPVSANYLTAIRAPAITTKLSGSVGSTAFDEHNVVRGSFSITNQCSGSEQVQIGQVYTAELQITLTGLTFTRYTLDGLRMVQQFGLLVDSVNNLYETVPLGVFFVGSANYEPDGVHITAYDAVSKLEKTCTAGNTTGTPYTLAKLACDACSVPLATPAGDFAAFANGTETLTPWQEGSDIETWRDFLSWLAQACGCYVTATRGGGIAFREYGQTVVDTIDTAHRFQDVKFSDFITRYTGLSCVNMADNTTSYYAETPDDALTYNLGSNPFLQYGTTAGLELRRRAVLTALQEVNYVPFTATTVCNPMYDLGDVLSFPGGLGDAAKLFCVTKYTWTYGVGNTLEGVGVNPALASAQSKTDKNLQGLAKQTESADAINFYTFTNANDINIGDGSTVGLFSIDYVTAKAARVVLQAEINVDVTPNTADGVVQGIVTYWLNGDPVLYQPTFTDGEGLHIEGLLYTWITAENEAGNVTATLNVTGGSVSVPVLAENVVLLGQGFAGATGDKTLTLDDSVNALDFDVLGDFTDAVTITTE